LRRKAGHACKIEGHKAWEARRQTNKLFSTQVTSRTLITRPSCHFITRLASSAHCVPPCVLNTVWQACVCAGTVLEGICRSADLASSCVSALIAVGDALYALTVGHEVAWHAYWALGDGWACCAVGCALVDGTCLVRVQEVARLALLATVLI
jgi:hypothetical protein